MVGYTSVWFITSCFTVLQGDKKEFRRDIQPFCYNTGK